MNLSATIAAVALATLSGATALAATLTPKGDVLVNKGTGFVRITGPIAVERGDMVVVNSGIAELVCETDRRGSIKDDDMAHILNKGQTYSIANECAATAAHTAAHNGISPGGLAIIGAIAKVGTGLLLIDRHPDRPGLRPGFPPRRPASP